MAVLQMRSNVIHVRSNAEEHCVMSGACARTQKRCACTQKRCARTQMRCARTQMRERPGIGGSAFDRKYCVRPHCRRLIYPGTEQKLKKGNKNATLIFFEIFFKFFWILSIQKHETNKINAQLK
jgi:hypothetical protein